MKDIANSRESLKPLLKKKTQLELIKETERVTTIKNEAYLMTEERNLKSQEFRFCEKQAHAYCEKVKPFLIQFTSNVDKLEGIVDDATWPLPKYREMLYLR